MEWFILHSQDGRVEKNCFGWGKNEPKLACLQTRFVKLCVKPTREKSPDFFFFKIKSKVGIIFSIATLNSITNVIPANIFDVEWIINRIYEYHFKLFSFDYAWEKYTLVNRISRYMIRFAHF